MSINFTLLERRPQKTGGIVIILNLKVISKDAKADWLEIALICPPEIVGMFYTDVLVAWQEGSQHTDNKIKKILARIMLRVVRAGLSASARNRENFGLSRATLGEGRVDRIKEVP